MKKSIVLFAICMLFIVGAKAQTSPSPRPKPASAPTSTNKPAAPRNTGVQAPTQTPASRPAQTPTHTPSTAPAKKGSGLLKANHRSQSISKAAPKVAKQSQTMQK
jgi:hypothetical protein